MFGMNRLRALLGLAVGLALLSLLLDTGCSRPTGLNGANDRAATDSHQTPFRDTAGKGSADSSPSPVSEFADQPAKDGTSLPFREPENLPAGTLLTVRLKNPVSAANPEAGGIFEAVVDEPVTVEGNTLVPRGASVAGRIESARPSKARGSGYVRVTLDSIDIEGKDLHLQTSSLFARGNGAGNGPRLNAITLEKGRRLTFRLTEPAYVVQSSSSGR
jgi:hypothetical protein